MQNKYSLRSVDRSLTLLESVSADTMKLYLRLTRDRIFEPNELVTDALKSWRELYEDAVIVTHDKEDGSMEWWTPDTFLCKKIE